MRFVAFLLAAAVVGAGVGLVAVGTAQAHGGTGGGDAEILQTYTTSCAGIQTAAVSTSGYACVHEDGGGVR